MSPRWPVLIAHHEHHELIPVACEQEWQRDPQLSAFPYAPEDRIIDSSGRLFRPIYERGPGPVRLQPLEQQLSLQAFSLLLRKHLCTRNACCISKLTLGSYQEGFALVFDDAQADP